MVDGSANPAETLINSLKAARKSPAVLKARLVGLRSSLPGCLVFAFEGDTDKAAYSQWVRQIRPALEYEPFPCDGKTQVLQLRAVLDRDLGGLGAGVFFFIDRDYDDLRGNVLGDVTFMTDKYSIENYLVSSSVLEELLKDEFHCHGQPTVRSEIITLFENQLTAFLRVTKEVNFRIFMARRLNIKILNSIPKKVKAVASIGLHSVQSVSQPADQIIVLEKEPAQVDRDRLETEFSEFRACDRYRGHFMFDFFLKWLQLLAHERNQVGSSVFKDFERARSVNYGAISVGILASKASLPHGLSSFINAIPIAV